MSTYRIWVDDGKHNEAEDGEDFDADLASDAVRQWAFDRYSVLQHVDPGVVLVRYPDGGSVTRWRVSTRILFDVRIDAVVEDNGDGA